MPRCVNAESFNVVIIYERLAHVGRALAAYRHLTHGLADEFAPDFRLWRIDRAREPDHAAEAERDLAAAEGIILAVDGGQPGPSAFQRWTVGAGHGGGPPPHAIIALREAPDGPEPVAGSWSNILRNTATQIHSEVLVCDPPPARGLHGLVPAKPPQAGWQYFVAADDFRACVRGFLKGPETGRCYAG